MKIINHNVYLNSNSILEAGKKSNLGYDTNSELQSSSYSSGNNKQELKKLSGIAKSNLKQNGENVDEILATITASSLKSTIQEIKHLNETQKGDFNYNKISSYKYEELSVNMAAKIRTDKVEVDINLKYNLKSSFLAQNNFVGGKDFKTDPLVISLNGDFPSLSSYGNTFEFDIDSEGSAWQISKLKKGSGFLALDKNNDGKINDGNELFGTKSGDGFADLAQFDDDANGWIDENDAIFHKLRIWLKTDKEDRLITLGESGVGAIFLGNVKTKMDLRSNFQSLNGTLKSSSFFLKNDGSAGALAQIDLVKRTQKTDIQKDDKNTKERSYSLETQKSFTSANIKDLQSGEFSRIINENFNKTAAISKQNKINIKTVENVFNFASLSENLQNNLVTNTNKKSAKFNTISPNISLNTIKDELEDFKNQQRKKIQSRIDKLQNSLLNAKTQVKKQIISQEIFMLQIQLTSYA
jgi:membrane protein